MRPAHRLFLTSLFAVILFSGVAMCGRSFAQAAVRSVVQAAPQSSARLEIKGDVEKPLSLSMDDLRHMPRTTLKVTNRHENKDETYEGVLLAEILRRAGVPQGPQMRGAAMATYVQAEATDGYRVIFSIAEVDPDFQDAQIMVADSIDGHSLPEKVGPLRIVAPHDNRPARWIRMLQSITVVRVGKKS